ncbi:Uncharacterised protein [Mycobacteroides abscessus subsp. massiliense]|uniref:hypothetical protein n=1 Tax=Mycobacteroides abscessus TaxID=36809 RepID=UPI0009CBE432|nr:hypothetical protein [Mycobacteroides abscessus]SKM82056.1 Uncharacterised protein [Mycobacteroides abscessus subsp. massiliense]SKM98751.1 Uncharacterised protein [Mycobacteroides abscessus subsp. massiliense]SKN77368.1 Uncharacterised protein [Mycobacteroides abscessus subsp. massiliense]SKN95817.1 Uncharacterised protein [Mycobacteroides abscessus subsp. massiliense]SKO22604.1 Uncharacterised protein [Mycobacteroides abscessus subsp. massiliense]
MTASEQMTAKDVLDALRWHHRSAALVPEVVIVDDYVDWNADNPDAGKFTLLEPQTRRIDALMFDTLERTTIEIKVSKADAGRESWRKVHPWRKVVHRYVYAVPAGLIDQPPVYGCGLWWVHPNGRVEVVRKTAINKTPEPLPQRVVQALAYRAAGQAVPA